MTSSWARWRLKSPVVSVVCTTVCSGADQRKHQSSASLVFVRWSHRWPVDSPHKGPVTLKMFPFDDAIIFTATVLCIRVRANQSGCRKKLGNGNNLQEEFNIIECSQNIFFTRCKPCVCYCLKPHAYEWGRRKMATIMETTFSNVFSWMKKFMFWSEFTGF